MKYRQPPSPALVKALVNSIGPALLFVSLLSGQNANPRQSLDESESAARQAKTYANVLRESAAHTLQELPANAAITIDTAANTITSGSALPVKETLQALIPKPSSGINPSVASLRQVRSVVAQGLEAMAQPLLKSGSVYNQEFAQRLNSSAQALRAKSAPEKQANTTASVSTSVPRARDRKQLAALTTRAPIYTAR